MKVLELRNLVLEIETAAGKIYPVEDVNLCLQAGKTMGLVGESGSGKSMTALAMLGLSAPAKIVGGRVLFYENPQVEFYDTSDEQTPLDNRLALSPTSFLQQMPHQDPEQTGAAIDLRKCSEAELRMFRGKKISMIFQEPMTALNPILTVGEQITETILAHENIKPQLAKEQAIELLKKVGIAEAERRYNSYPHEMSGGMRQRAMIAMAISCNPSLLIADEPTTALDVTLQAQVLDLLKQLVEEKQMALLLISHDLSLIARYCDEVAVMYTGKIVEQAAAKEFFSRPKHPYTQGLLYSLPSFLSETQWASRAVLKTISGQVPSLHHLPKACRFVSRCEKVSANSCSVKAPPLKYIGDGHWVRCVNA